MKAIGSSDAAMGQFSSATGIIQRKQAKVNDFLQIHYNDMGPLTHCFSNVRVILGVLSLYFDNSAIDGYAR
jgi:hypothetical protein